MLRSAGRRRHPPGGQAGPGGPDPRRPDQPDLTDLEDDVLAALLLAEEAAETANHLPMSPVAFGLLAFGGLMVLLLVTFAFRSVGTRH